MMSHEEMIDLAEQHHWRVERGGNNHIKLYSPDGEHIVVASSTPSDHRALLNFRAQLRKAGLPVEDEHHEKQKRRFRKGELELAMKDMMAKNPAKTYHADDILPVLKSVFPWLDLKQVYHTMAHMHHAGSLVRVSQGFYRLPKDVSTEETPVISTEAQQPIAARAPAPAPIAAVPTTSGGLSDDMAEINEVADQLLDAVTRFQAVMGRAQGVLSQLDALRAILTPPAPKA